METAGLDFLDSLDSDQLKELEAESERIEFTAARDSFAVYCGLHLPQDIEKDDLPGLKDISLPARYVPADHHRIIIRMLEALEAGEYNGRALKNLMILAPPGSAKALALDTPIPTPSGWRMMGDLQIGDCVFDETGKICHVTWVSPIFVDRPVYKVRTDCGDEIIADHDHEWRARLDIKQTQPFDYETHVIARKRTKRAMVVRAQAIQLPEAELPVDPYLLGVWLGDGTASTLAITSSLDDIQWMRSEIHRLGYSTSSRTVTTLFGVLGIRDKFVSMGLINDPSHKTYGKKYIPRQYMRSSIEQRKSLLQGLIDTDGTVCKRRGCATFCNTNREMALQVRELVRSLGVKAGWSESPAMLYGVQHGTAYRVSFYMADAARMPRKRILCRDQYRTPNTYIDAEPWGTADTVCIEVDSPSHLYLCGLSMTPTHNSSYCSALFPAWYLGRHPTHCIIQGSQTDELAGRFGRRARNAFASEVHQRTFQGVGISSDAKAAGAWETTAGGEYYATGVQPFAGRRADLLVLDDLIRGFEDADSNTVRDKIWSWYIQDAWPRLKPKGKQVFVTTRFHENDPAGRILPPSFVGKTGWVRGRDGQDWYVITFVAVVENEEDKKNDPVGRDIGQILWPEWFTPSMMETAKELSGLRGWYGKYQQKPRPDGGAILLANWWRPWQEIEPPKCELVIQVWDTAFEEGEENAYSARTTWGIFPYTDKVTVGPVENGQTRDVMRYCALLLEAWRGKVEFPELREEAIRGNKKYKPDRVLIERKASGHSLIQELRRAGLPARPANPKHVSKSKRARGYAAQTVLEDGCIFYPCKWKPDGHGGGKWVPYSWVQAVIDECASYPDGEYNDFGDTCSHAWIWLRNWMHLELTDDPEDEKDTDEKPVEMFGRAV